VRLALDRILEPLLNPIRRIIPSAGMMDFSPLILIVLIQLLSRIIVSVLTQ
jgi:YggT family protein